ncbi:hypothetical protein HY256_08665 [Candidatus Sumerlaeota bacterium]|nr:hypothetical protein [Candidatus Sumerlaeota bacterium]
MNHSRLGAVPLYTLGSMAHWRYFGFFLLARSPVGLPVCIGFARRIVRPDARFVAASAACA